MAVLSRAFLHAAHGIAHAWRTQRNFRIQVVIALVAVGVLAFLRAHLVYLTIVALTIALVLGLELLNTALEALVDLASPERHPLAKAAKDAAAAAVLVAAGGAVVVGILALVAALGSR